MHATPVARVDVSRHSAVGIELEVIKRNFGRRPRIRLSVRGDEVDMRDAVIVLDRHAAQVQLAVGPAKEPAAFAVIPICQGALGVLADK